MKKFLCLMLAFVIVLAGGEVLAATDDSMVIRNRKSEVFEDAYPVELLDTLPKDKALTYEEMIIRLKKEGFNQKYLDDYTKSHNKNMRNSNFNTIILY